jgi:hypothetical protein
MSETRFLGGNKKFKKSYLGSENSYTFKLYMSDYLFMLFPVAVVLTKEKNGEAIFHENCRDIL